MTAQRRSSYAGEDLKKWSIHQQFGEQNPLERGHITCCKLKVIPIGHHAEGRILCFQQDARLSTRTRRPLFVAPGVPIDQIKRVPCLSLKALGHGPPLGLGLESRTCQFRERATRGPKAYSSEKLTKGATVRIQYADESSHATTLARGLWNRSRRARSFALAPAKTPGSPELPSSPTE